MPCIGVQVDALPYRVVAAQNQGYVGETVLPASKDAESLSNLFIVVHRALNLQTIL